MSESDSFGDLRHGVPPMAISSMSTRVNKTGTWKYIRPIYRDRVAPCNAGCPQGIDIEAYMNLVRLGRLDEACELLLRENPLPATTGRVCYHPCQDSCNRRNLDESVSIHAVERMLGDRLLASSKTTPLPRNHDEKIAVVGSGPAGLACAFHLTRLGYAVTIFEAEKEPGGILRFGIPEYRLPKRVLAAEIDRIRAMGVEIRCNTRVGTDLPQSELDEFDAIYLATGVHKSRSLRIDNEDCDGIRSGLDFLRRVNFDEPPDIGKKVIVIGGGNTAMDCCRTALRLGAEPIVLYRRTRAEMPANHEELVEAEEEGIEFQFLAAPISARVKDGRLEGIDCIRMKLGDVDSSGRRSPVRIEGSEFFLEADTVLTAIGESPDLSAVPDGVEHDDWEVAIDELGGTNRAKVFAGGDIVAQPHTVVDALGSGKRSAIGIARFLQGIQGVDENNIARLRFGEHGNPSMSRCLDNDPVERIDPVNEVVPYGDLNMDHFTKAPVHPDKHLDVDQSLSGFEEVNLGLTDETAIAEASRCFNCGVCNECEICLIFCPDVAIMKRADGKGFDIDYDYCKGCGLCNVECPRGAMAMTREGL